MIKIKNMLTKQEQRFCKNCNKIMPATKRVPNHVLHFILSFITGGIWLFVWLLVILAAGTEKFKCVQCGKNVE